MSQGLFVAAMVVTLMQFLRVRRRRLLPVLALFAFLALAESREHWDVWRRGFHAFAVVAGLGLVVVLSAPHEEDRRRSP